MMAQNGVVLLSGLPPVPQRLQPVLRLQRHRLAHLQRQLPVARQRQQVLRLAQVRQQHYNKHMATDRGQANTHVTNLTGRIRTRSSDPTNPVAGDMYYNTTTNSLCIYSGNNWLVFAFS